jgi:hypothetical protein
VISNTKPFGVSGHEQPPALGTVITLIAAAALYYFPWRVSRCGAERRINSVSQSHKSVDRYRFQVHSDFLWFSYLGILQQRNFTRERSSVFALRWIAGSHPGIDLQSAGLMGVRT